MKALTAKARKAVSKYSEQKCRDAFTMYNQGNGASTIGYDLGLTTNQADAAINAGRELAQA